jgi:hypothetical protein
MSAAEQRNWLAEEIGARMVQKWIRGRHSRRSVKFSSHKVHEPAPGRTRGELQALTRVERDVEGEFLLSEFDTTFDEFNEMVIQYGYLALFAPAFSLAPLIALVNIGLDVKAILTPPCIFHVWLSIQNIQGAIRMTLTSTPR